MAVRQRMTRIGHVVRAASSGAGWRYAAAEIAITTVGILIALAANAWWQNREDRQTELIALREMRSALVADTVDLHLDVDRYRFVELSARNITAHIDSGLPYDTSLDSLFGGLYIYRMHLSNSAAYESLKSMGLGF